MKIVKSPLTYPGGKHRAVRSIAPFIPRGTKEICSPFFGGGSLEVYWASRGIRVYGYDVFEALTDFWWGLLHHREDLIRRIESYHPLARETFYHLQKTYSHIEDRLERSAVFFVLNKSSFSGLTFSGGMSPGHRDLNPKTIDYLRNFKINNFSVDRMSFHQSIPMHKNSLLYLDPPYYIKSHLYGDRGNTHRDFDHEGLVDILKSRDRWILSYNDCETIHDMYSDFHILYPTWKYGISRNKESSEILILSPDMSEYANKNGLLKRYSEKVIDTSEQMSLF